MKGPYKENLLEEKEQILSVVAFSANEGTIERLEKFFKKEGIGCFFFYEYFLSQPVSHGISEDEIQKMTSSVPYLRRYIEFPEIKFIPDIEKIKKLDKNTKFSDLIEDPPLISKTEKSLEKVIKENLLRVNLSDEPIYGRNGIKIQLNYY